MISTQVHSIRGLSSIFLYSHVSRFNMCTVNFSDLTHHVGVSEADLDQQCSREHLATIAKEIDNWLDYAYLLGLSDQDVNGIRADSMLSYGMQVQTTLGMWQKKNGFKATYRCLVEIFLNEKNVTVANVVCSLIKGMRVCGMIVAF